MGTGNITEVGEGAFVDLMDPLPEAGASGTTWDLDSAVVLEPEDESVPCPPEGDPRLKLLSYSSSLLLHSCPRKYQLQKLGTNARPVDNSTQLTFDFGHAIGDAVVSMLSGESFQNTLFRMFHTWPSHLFEENVKQKKSFFHAVQALELFQAAREDGLLEDYELVTLANGRPAAEVSIKIYLPGGYIERGYIDMILRNKYSGEYCVFDNKTSSARWMNSGTYANSMQALGYSVALRQIDPDHVPVNYTVFYLVWMTYLEKWIQFDFPKTIVQQAQWLQAKLWDVQTLERLRETYGDYGIWPLHGEACMSYGRECQFMHECHMATEGVMKPLTQRSLDEFDSPLDNTGKPWDIVVHWEELAHV